MTSSRRPGSTLRCLCALLVAIAGLAASSAARAAWNPGSRSVEFTTDFVPSSAAQVDALRQAKLALPADAPLLKIDSAIQDRATALTRAQDPRRGFLVADFVATFSTPLVPVDEAGRMLVRIAGTEIDTPKRLAMLATLDVEPVAIAAGYGILEAWIPAARIADVAALAWIRNVGVPGLPVTEIGLRLSEGDAIHRADQARAAFAVDGTGTTVGVISDGVTSLAQAQASNDLPAVQVGLTGSGDEGTAMLEIVHDLAPGAGLAFYSAGSGTAGMIAAQNWLVGTAGARVVSDDIWMPREPYFEDGPVALNAAGLVTGNDVVYFTSAGNRAQRHIPQAFVDGGARTLGVLGATRPHQFGAGDYTADIRLRNPNGTGVRHTIVLQWGERFGLAGRDFDLYLVDASLSNIIALSTNAQAGAGDPLELIDFTYNGPDNAPARLVIDYRGALPAPVGMALKIAANGPTFLEYVNAAGSINPHARHPLVYALGAINQSDPGADTPEPFSSRGLADMLFPAPAQRNKPDAMAIDGVTVTGVGGFPSPFFGTSAASPHGAGIAALIRGALPALTAAEVRTTLSTTAIDIGPAGFDAATGAGRLDALLALRALLNEPPVADAGPDTTVECGAPAGTAVTLNGLRSSDPEDDPLAYAWAAPGIVFDDATSATPSASFPMGATVVTLTVSDGQFFDDDEVVVTIEDTLPPQVTVVLDPASLWPPNHKLAAIHATVTALDVCDEDPAIRLVSITSDEPENDLGDGDKPDDIQEEIPGTPDFDFLLRSERQGPEQGRTYTVCYEAEDLSGNIGSQCATVVVTHDQAALAAFTPLAPGSDVTVEGGWIEITPDASIPPAALAAEAPAVGGDAFARVSLPPGSGEGAVRWFVPGSTVCQILAGADEPVLYARLEHDGAGYLAAVPLPIPPAVFAEVARAGRGSGAIEAVPPGADAPAVESNSSLALPTGLVLRAASPLRRGQSFAYGLPAPGRVRLSLVAANGRRAALLVDESRAAGWHVALLPPGLDPGVYFAVAELRGERSVARVIVLR